MLNPAELALLRRVAQFGGTWDAHSFYAMLAGRSLKAKAMVENLSGAPFKSSRVTITRKGRAALLASG